MDLINNILLGGFIGLFIGFIILVLRRGKIMGSVDASLQKQDKAIVLMEESNRLLAEILTALKK